MGRAEDIFNRLVKSGEQAINDFILDRQSEELFLDFKRSADNGTGRRLHDNDRSNLAKAISGFGNSEGGVIVWGIDCRDAVIHGDVATCMVPIENPKRFVSWLEGVVSGCTVPAHPHVRHHAIKMTGTDKGFVASYIPKSYVAPHQTVRPPQYYIRAGSDFVPAPHGVLSGLFGRHPEPFVFHGWLHASPSLQPDSRTVYVNLAFNLSNKGPGIARELYVNLKATKPNGCDVRFNINDRANWTGQFTMGFMLNLISIESFRLSPGGYTEPFAIEAYLCPPFEGSLWYEITFGHQNWPYRKLTATIEDAKLQEAYDTFLRDSQNDQAGKRFVAQVFGIREAAKDFDSQAYDLWLAGEQSDSHEEGLPDDERQI